MKIIYTQHAIKDLQRLREFIAKDNPHAAADIANKLKHAVHHLRDFPLMGKEVTPKKNSHPLRDLIIGKYIIRYTVLGNELHLLRVWHGKEERITIQAP